MVDKGSKPAGCHDGAADCQALDQCRNASGVIKPSAELLNRQLRSFAEQPVLCRRSDRFAISADVLKAFARRIGCPELRSPGFTHYLPNVGHGRRLEHTLINAAIAEAVRYPAPSNA
jgi:hypothetical protein